MESEQHSELARKYWASLSAKKRSAIGQKAAETRRRNTRARRLSKIAHKAVRTRRRNAKRRSEIGKKAARTRARNASKS